jgi:hypothetical protein
MNPIHEVHQEAKPATWRPVMLHPDEREETALPKRCGQIGGPFPKSRESVVVTRKRCATLSSLGLSKLDLAL